MGWNPPMPGYGASVAQIIFLHPRTKITCYYHTLVYLKGDPAALEDFGVFMKRGIEEMQRWRDEI